MLQAKFGNDDADWVSAPLILLYPPYFDNQHSVGVMSGPTLEN